MWRRLSQRHRVADLVCNLAAARDELTLSHLHRRYRRIALLVLDERGFPARDANCPTVMRGGHLAIAECSVAQEVPES